MSSNKDTKTHSKGEDSNGKQKDDKTVSKTTVKAKSKIAMQNEDEDSMKIEEKFEVKEEEVNGKRKASTHIEKVATEVDSKGKVVKIQKTDEATLTSKWWEKESVDEEVKWQYLEHKGVIFPPFYKPQKFKVTYNGNPVELSPYQEEMAYYWSQTIGTDWETKEHYKKNFEREFLKTFDKSLGYTSLAGFDFSEIVKYIAEQKEIKKNRTAEEKKIEKDAKKAKDDYYGFAIVDYDLEKVGGYAIEPPTLFKGRGTHPKAGLMKARIMPEDITINISEKAPVPKCDMPGHCWGDIVHNNTVTWLAFYKDDTINTTYKYIFLAASSKFRGLSDRKKYDKARKLKDHIEMIRKDYRKKLLSKDKYEKQLGTATYLIDFLALRVGNEKSEDEADTVGCCSLRVEHVQVLPDNQITLDFLGKDSMRYYNTVTVDPEVHKNIKSFIEGKKPSENLFDRIDASNLNDYLRSLMDGLTAKVFRTYNASITLEKELRKRDVSDLDLEEKIAFYDEANRQVAILCNHQKTVSKTFDVSVGKQKRKIEDMKEYLEQLKTHLKKLKRGEKGLDEETIEKQVAKKIKDSEDEDLKKIKPIKRKFPSSEERTSEEIKKLEKKIQKEEKKVTMREENKAIALGTSKLNYNDPRITVRWCKANEVPIERVFSKTIRSKFPWAMYTDLDWTF